MCLWEGSAGVDKDETKAIELWRAAGEQSCDALFHLGTAYREGRGLPQNDDEADRLLARAAELGNAEAKKQLAEGLVETALTRAEKKNARKRTRLQERGKAVERNLEDALSSGSFLKLALTLLDMLSTPNEALKRARARPRRKNPITPLASRNQNHHARSEI